MRLPIRVKETLLTLLIKFKYRLNINICCAKTITIKKSVYDELIRFKKENESFSEFLERLVKSQSKHDLLLSLRRSVEFEGKDEFLKEVEKKRWEREN